MPLLRRFPAPLIALCAALTLAHRSATATDIARPVAVDCDTRPVRAAALAAGASPRSADGCDAALRKLATWLSVKFDGRLDEVATARVIHLLLYDHVLHGGYEPSCDDPAATLNAGPFNCLSASVLFQALAKSRGL